MSDMISSSKEPYRRSGGWLRGVLTFILVVVLFFGVGVAIYFGVPYVEKRVMKPIQDNSQEIETIQSQQAEENRSSGERMNDLQSQIDTIKLQQDRDKETLAELDTRLQGAEGWKDADTLLSERLDLINKRLETLEKTQKEFEAALETRQKEGRDQAADIASLEKKVEEQALPLEQLKAEVLRMQVSQRLTRCRVFLEAGNYGDTGDCLAEARRSLMQVPENLSDTERSLLLMAAERLALTIDDLPGTPQLAVQDLNIAQDLLIQGGVTQLDEIQQPTPGLPASSPTETGTATPPPALESTPTKVPLTPQGTSQPTPQPTTSL